MKFALVDEENLIVNIIVYDGESDYTPPAGLSLVQVSDEKQIGDTL